MASWLFILALAVAVASTLWRGPDRVSVAALLISAVCMVVARVT